MDTILEWIQPHFDRWGYAIVFAGTLLENSAFLGAVVPGDVILLLGGVYADRGELTLPRLIGVGFAGAVIGDSLGYLLGRLAGRRIVNRFGDRFFLPRKRLERIDRYFAEYGMWAVALGRMAPAVRTLNTFVAGMSCMDYRRFILAAGSSAAVWTAVVASLGWVFSESLRFVDRSLGAGGIVLVVLLFVAIFFTYRRMMKRLQLEEPAG